MIGAAYPGAALYPAMVDPSEGIPPTLWDDAWAPPAGHPDSLPVRVESWWVYLLTPDDGVVAVLDGVTGGSLTINGEAQIHGGGTITMDDAGTVDWLNARVQPWVAVGDQSWPLGVYVCSVPATDYTDAVTSATVDLLDKLAILDGAEIANTYSLPAGTVVTSAVRSLIEAAGEDRISLTESAKTLPAGVAWPPGTSRLRIVNDLLASINYWSLRCDPYGRYVVAPYTEPARRPIARVFARGDAAIHTPDMRVTQDLAAVPNRVVLTSTGTSGTEGLVGVADNIDPGSPFSIPSRGRVLSRTEQVDAADQATIMAMASRRLAELTSVTRTVSMSHAWVPLWPHDIAVVTDRAVTVTRSVQSTTTDLQVGALQRTLLREVAT